VLRVASITPVTRNLVFRHIYTGNKWGDEQSVSGKGSNLEQTRAIRTHLPALLAQHDIKSMLDIPCGDRLWMRELALPLERYVGADVVVELIRAQQPLAKSFEEFLVLDASKDPLPSVDLVFCRDLLVHLDFVSIDACLENFRRSGSRLLLTTSFTNRQSNHNIPTGRWRPLNLQRPPFNFPVPLELLNEECTEGNGAYRDKCLALWDLQSLNI
jgi:hypothetical protein